MPSFRRRRPIIPAQPPLPPFESGPAEGEPELLQPRPENVQGDVYLTLPKHFERFLFFKIADTEKFLNGLRNYFPHITSSAKTAEDINVIRDNKNQEDLDFPSSNIAFSRAGLDTLGIKDKLRDDEFDGSSERSESHGVILVTAKKEETCKDLYDKIRGVFNESISVVSENLDGHKLDEDREYFGWVDGISQPALEGLTDIGPGQLVVKPGVIILGYPGDPVYDDSETKQRPEFTKDGSFMVYSKLEQHVLLFEDYVDKNWRSISPQPAPGYLLTDDQRKELFCARLFGRFRSGVPLALSPYIDDHVFLSDGLINNFNYTERTPGTGCPLFAHILKTNPRSVDLEKVPEQVVKASVVVRAGIPYGPAVTDKEREEFKVLGEKEKAEFPSKRGLLFVCYQASIFNGFLRQLEDWSRNDSFPPSFAPIGQDPIIGHPQQVFGSASPYTTHSGPEPVYVRQQEGGLYFVPSLSTVKEWARIRDD